MRNGKVGHRKREIEISGQRESLFLVEYFLSYMSRINSLHLKSCTFLLIHILIFHSAGVELSALTAWQEATALMHYG